MVEKKNILFVCRNMVVGGIEAASVNFINTLYDSVNIEIMMFNKCGKLLNYVNPNVKIYEGGKLLKLIYRDVQLEKKNNDEKLKTKKSLKDICKIVLKKVGVRKLIVNFALVGQRIDKKYDVVVCIDARDKLCAKFALDKVIADKKFGFIHNDLSMVDNKKQEIKLLKKFDTLFCVSESCASIAKIVIPSVENKIDFLYNFQNENIGELSKEYDVQFEKNKLNIVSVSRLSKEKAILRSLNVFKTLKQLGYNFVWHIVGGGDQLNKIVDFIEENNMDSYVKLYGEKNNPYPYIKNADVFYLGSYHEAAPTVFSEAKILGIPIITTRTCSAEELVKGYGLVCDNTEEGIFDIFKELFEGKLDFKEIKTNLKKYKNINDEIKSKFLNLL